jgi:hypothetical protein
MTRLCDFKLEGGKTCDAPMCDKHATRIGRNTDYCPQHKSAAEGVPQPMNDQEFLERNAHIPTDEIRDDIAKTEQEIIVMEKEADHLERTPMTLSSARLDHMKASARRSRIAEARKFTDKLKHLLELRKSERVTP